MENYPVLSDPDTFAVECQAHLDRLNAAWMLIGFHDSAGSPHYQSYLEWVVMSGNDPETSKLYEMVKQIERQFPLMPEQYVLLGKRQVKKEIDWFEMQGIPIERYFDLEQHRYIFLRERFSEGKIDGDLS